MSQPDKASTPDKPSPHAKTMDAIVALCKRRGFVFQSSEIYGGINGFWDYGPLGVELKRNLKDAWWRDIVKCPGTGPDGKSLVDMMGLDCTIIMNPKVWVASGHVGGFSDPMSTCRQCKKLFRSDHVEELVTQSSWFQSLSQIWNEGDSPSIPALKKWSDREGKKHAPGLAIVRDQANVISKLDSCLNSAIETGARENINQCMNLIFQADGQRYQEGICPNCGGDLTEPRNFNLMFESHAGPIQSDDNKVYLRPETAQGIFVNFRNVVDTSRVKVPFGIAQIGKAFRNEVTPRNFTFRSREFEQMEIEFFIHPDSANEWYKYWRDARFAWWQSIGLAGENLTLREHDRDELAHYAKEGAGTSDIEYRFPFTAPGYGELEGIAHRTDFDLKQHAQHSGLGDKLKYFDQELQVKLQGEGKLSKEEIAAKSKYFPHVIEPSAGADRGTLALICEAYTADESRPSGVFMKFHPRMAPIKAGIFPLVAKDGLPEVAEKLYRELRSDYNVEFDTKQSIGKRYARMDEAGTPYCFTIDGETLSKGQVTVRDRDTLAQQSISIDKVGAFLKEKIG